LYDLYLLFLRGLGALLGFFGYRRRGQPWGTVYDAVTKQPIDPAYVVVEQAGETVTNAITDIDGRFGFFLPAGQYALKANKTHYQFPSQILNGKERDELYDNLYFGDVINSNGEEVISRNIPLDPIGFDWNEFMKNRVNYFTLYSKRELIRNRIINAIFVIGFVLSLAAVLVAPSNFNFIVLLSYLVIYLIELVWKIRHKVVSIKKANGEMLSFAVIKIYMSGVNQMIKTVIADQFGRFYALVRPGTYYYTIEEKQVDGSYREAFRSGDIEFKKGVFTRDIVVPG
ncbi:MAG: carboxypeptidase-like regulatory domain-containing protein, partial [bacterium]